jgi:adenine-specific DNA-methyltransferase
MISGNVAPGLTFVRNERGSFTREIQSEGAGQSIHAAWDWIRKVDTSRCPPCAVAGASDSEGRHLAALGALARAISGPPAASWPFAVRVWMSNSVSPPEALVRSIRSAMKAGLDPLGDLYLRVVSQKSRRTLGTFFTPSPVLDWMIANAAEVIGTPHRVVDPGAGVGAFSLAAAKRWPQAEILAIDINVATLGLTAVASQSQGADIALVLTDYMEWLNADRTRSEEPTLYIGNPPYTRASELSLGARSRYTELTAGVTPLRSSLATHFLAATLQRMNPQDALVFLLPSSWVDADYGERIRALLNDDRHRAFRLVGLEAELPVFAHADVAPTVAILGSVRPQSRAHQVSHATLSDGRLVEGVRRNLGATSDAMRAALWGRKRPKFRGPELRTIATVRRGVATGANEHFFVTKDYARRLPPEAVTRAVLRLRSVEGVALDARAHESMSARGERAWLVKPPRSYEKHPAVLEWIKQGENRKFDQRYLTANRVPWWEVETIDPPHILVGAMGKGTFRVVTNESRALPSNNVIGISVRDLTSIKPLAKWLLSAQGQRALRSRARAYGNQLYKLEPRQLGLVQLPAGLAERHSGRARGRDEPDTA